MRPRISERRPCRGIERIVGSIKKFDIECGFWNRTRCSSASARKARRRASPRRNAGRAWVFTDQTIYEGDELKNVLGAEGYSAGIRYTGTYGVNPLLCLQGFKDVLIDAGTQVFESTEVIRIEGHTAFARGGSVTAEHIIVAVDKLKADISPLADEVFHAQTSLSVSEPLHDKDLIRLFPGGKQMQCWDSRLVYTYFRLTGDNRLLVGGGTAVTTYLKEAYNNHRIISRVIRRFKTHFPFLHDLAFIQFWPGLIDATRDLLPIIVRPPQQPHLHFVLGAVGLPWAAFAGSFAARNVLGEADEDYKKYYRYFSNRRHFVFPSGLVKIVGKPLIFSLSNAWAKFYQVDQRRLHREMKGEF
jgi:gamma-glutamylputrescine oxidase